MKTNRWINISLLVILFLGFLTVFGAAGYWIKDNIHEPAMASVRSGCNLPEYENDGWVSLGSTSTTYNEDIEAPEIIVEVEDELILNGDILLTVVRHELCHVDQMTRGILSPTECNETQGKFRWYANEVECYWRQYFPRDDINETAVKAGDISSVEDMLKEAILPMMG